MRRRRALESITMGWISDKVEKARERKRLMEQMEQKRAAAQTAFSSQISVLWGELAAKIAAGAAEFNEQTKGMVGELKVQLSPPDLIELYDSDNLLMHIQRVGNQVEAGYSKTINIASHELWISTNSEGGASFYDVSRSGQTQVPIELEDLARKMLEPVIDYLLKRI